MAGTTTKNKATCRPESREYVNILEHNKLVLDLETLRAAFAALVTKLNADAGVTDTNYATVLAAALLAAQVGDESGNTTY